MILLRSFLLSAFLGITFPLAAQEARKPLVFTDVSVIDCTWTEGEELLEAQRKKIAIKEVKTRYRLRGQTVERGFGDANGNRGVDRFHGRGLSRARGETGLLTLAQNLLRFDKSQRDAVYSS